MELQFSGLPKISFQNVERVFALLLLRFPRVNKLNQKSIGKKIKIVMSCCFLHNICILEKDNIEFYLNRAQQVNKAFYQVECKH